MTRVSYKLISFKKTRISSEPNKSASNDQRTPVQEFCSVFNEKHDIEDCKYYLWQILLGRSTFIFKKKFCYEYLKNIAAERSTTTSVRSKTCKVCIRKHPIIMHDHKRKKAKTDDYLTETESNDEPSDGSVKCTSVSSGTNISSIMLQYVNVLNCSIGRLVRLWKHMHFWIAAIKSSLSWENHWPVLEQRVEGLKFLSKHWNG